MSVKKVVTTQYIGEGEHAGFNFHFEPLEDTLTIEKTKEGYTARYLVRWNSYLSGDVYILAREDYNKDKESISYVTCGECSGYKYALAALKTDI